MPKTTARMILAHYENARDRLEAAKKTHKVNSPEYRLAADEYRAVQNDILSALAYWSVSEPST